MNSSAFHLNYVIKDIIERKHRLYFLCEISPPFCQTKINKPSFGQSPRCSLFPEGTLRLASDVFQFLLSPSTVEVYLHSIWMQVSSQSDRSASAYAVWRFTSSPDVVISIVEVIECIQQYIFHALLVEPEGGPKRTHSTQGKCNPNNN